MHKAKSTIKQGRPKLSEDEKLVHLGVYLRPEEKEKCVQVAKNEKRSVSAWAAETLMEAIK